MLRLSRRRRKEFFSSNQSRWLHKAGVRVDDGVDDVETTTSPNAQAAAREEFARPQKNQQMQRLTAWGNEQTKQFDPGG